MSNNDERQERIAQIRARVEAATPGPWKVQTDSDDDPDNYWPWRVITDDETGVIVDFTGGDIPPDEDAALIANAPADLAWLTRELDAATARAERAEAF